MHMCKAACLFARPFADMQRRAFMCSSACLCARPSVYLQAAMHVCTTPCLFAARPAYMHVHMHACTLHRITSAQIESASRPLGGGDLSTRIAPRKSSRGF